MVARPDNSGENRLDAYVATGEKGVNNSEIRDHLGKTLPPHMIPVHIMELENLPLTPGGKVDRRALPLPEQKSDVPFVAPRDRVEVELARLWGNVLGTGPENTLGIDDNFFHLEGHSLKATQLVAGIHKNMNVRLPLTAVFDNPTIRGLKEYIRNHAPEAFNAVETGWKTGSIILLRPPRNACIFSIEWTAKQSVTICPWQCGSTVNYKKIDWKRSSGSLSGGMKVSGQPLR